MKLAAGAARDAGVFLRARLACMQCRGDVVR